MTDIVERLLNRAQDVCFEDLAALFVEAAEKIELLRNMSEPLYTCIAEMPSPPETDDWIEWKTRFEVLRFNIRQCEKTSPQPTIKQIVDANKMIGADTSGGDDAN